MKIRSKFLGRVLAAGVAGLLAVSLGACSGAAADGAGGASPAPTDEKATSGEITVYTALEDELVTEYLAVFNAEYPDIKVNVVRESTGIITAKLLAEKAGHGAADGHGAAPAQRQGHGGRLGLLRQTP